MPTARWAATDFQPEGEALSTYSESPLLRNSHHAAKIFFSIALIRRSRKAANPAGVPIVQCRIAASGVATIALSPIGARNLGDHLIQVHPHHRIGIDHLLGQSERRLEPTSNTTQLCSHTSLRGLLMGLGVGEAQGMVIVDIPASTPTRRGLRLVPGLVVVAVATAAAYVVARAVPALNPSTVAVVLGALLANMGLHRRVLHPGTHLASHRLLRISIVLLGLQLSLRQLVHLGSGGLVVVLVTVTVTFLGTQLLGRAMGMSAARGLLVATGFSICGASAVAAMEPVAGGDEEDTGIAIALVTLCGSLAILILPALRVPLGLDVVSFGSWVGASVHDVGQTVATADRVPGALSTAVVVKLTRVVLLAPLVAGVSLTRRRQRTGALNRGRRPAPVPLFVAGFLGSVVITSTGALPHVVLNIAKIIQGVLLAAALVGLGTTIHLPTLRRTGGRSLLLGLASWILVASIAYLGVRLLGR